MRVSGRKGRMLFALDTNPSSWWPDSLIKAVTTCQFRSQNCRIVSVGKHLPDDWIQPLEQHCWAHHWTMPTRATSAWLSDPFREGDSSIPRSFSTWQPPSPSAPAWSLLWPRSRTRHLALWNLTHLASAHGPSQPRSLCRALLCGSL